MGSREQFETYKYVYELEEKRFEELISRAKLYISIITIYLAILTIKVQDVTILAKGNKWGTVFAVLAGGAFILSLLFAVLSLGIYEYEGLCDIKQQLLIPGSVTKPDEEFYEDRLADLAVAYERNSIQNDKRANLLTISSWTIFIGITCHMVAFLIYAFGGRS